MSGDTTAEVYHLMPWHTYCAWRKQKKVFCRGPLVGSSSPDGSLTIVGDLSNSFLESPQYNLLEDLLSIVKTMSKLPGSLLLMLPL